MQHLLHDDIWHRNPQGYLKEKHIVFSGRQTAPRIAFKGQHSNVAVPTMMVGCVNLSTATAGYAYDSIIQVKDSFCI